MVFLYVNLPEYAACPSPLLHRDDENLSVKDRGTTYPTSEEAWWLPGNFKVTRVAYSGE